MESNANSLTEVLNQREIVNVVETVPHVKEDYANNARKDFSLAQVSALHVQAIAINVQEFGTVENVNQNMKWLMESAVQRAVLAVQQLHAILASQIIS
jgi:hypothetical protein